MKAYECGDATKAETKWFRWLERCETLIGRSLAAIEAHSDLWDMYCDGATPEDAINEALVAGLEHLQ